MTVTPHDLRRLALALTAVGVCCVLPIALGAPVDLLLAAPVLLLALPLLAGRYVGEDALRRLARRDAPRARRGTGGGVRAILRGAVPPRGGLLLAFGLAVRPPPGAPAIR